MQTVCSAMNSTETYKQMLSEAHKLANLLALHHPCNNVDLRSSPRWNVFFTILLTSNEDKDWIIASMLLHAHDREITDDLDLVKVARNFVDANDERKSIFDLRLLFGNIKTFCLLYFNIHLTERILQFTIICYLLSPTACNLSSKRGVILMFITVSWINTVSKHDTYWVN